MVRRKMVPEKWSLEKQIFGKMVPGNGRGSPHDFLFLNFPGPFFRGPIFRGPFFRGPFFRGPIFPGTIFPGIFFSRVHFSGDHFSGIRLLLANTSEHWRTLANLPLEAT